jgi:hypothetical protein
MKQLAKPANAGFVERVEWDAEIADAVGRQLALRQVHQAETTADALCALAVKTAVKKNAKIAKGNVCAAKSLPASHSPRRTKRWQFEVKNGRSSLM